MKSTQPLIDHLYPSDMASQLFISGNELVVRTNGSFKEGEKPQHLYLCSTQIAKNGEWCFYKNNLGGSAICKAKDTPYGRVYQVEGRDYGHPTGGITPLKDEIFKIEFATDLKLTKCGCGLSGKWIDHEDGMYQEHKFGCETKSFVGVGAIDMNTKALGSYIMFPKSDARYDVNFLEEYCKCYNNRKVGFEKRFGNSKILRLKEEQKDNQKGVDVEKLAKEFLGIPLSVNMESDEERYYNPKYRDYQNFVNGYNQALQSNVGGFSLEDIELFLKWADKKYLFNEDGRWENKIDFGGVFYTTTPELLKEFQSLTKKQNDPYPDGGRCQREEEDETRCEKRCDHCIEYYKPLDKEQDEYMKEYPPFGGPYPEKEPKGNVMIECEIEGAVEGIYQTLHEAKIKLDSNGQPILIFK